MERVFLGKAALGQVAVVVAILVAVAFWPPQRGAMLMVPLSGRVVGVVDVALSGHAGLLATGPLPGSMIVIGDRAALAGPALDRGILLLAAPRAWCGARDKDIV